MSTEETALRFFKALANAARLRIVGLLADRDMSVEELSERLGVSSPTVSHHLGKLKDIGLVEMRSEGTRHLYSPDRRTFRLHLKSLEKMAASLGSGGERDTRDRDDPSRIVENFLDGERLRSIPEKLSKRVVVLRWVAERFEPGVRYPEREVNRILKQHYDDHATLRRLLVNEGLLSRDHGIYWRTG
jgi:biotin operon repressor